MAYRGNAATLPTGLQGFSGSKNPSKMGPGHLSSCEGVDIDGGVVVKEGGATKLNEIALGDPSRIVAGTNWSPAPGGQVDVVFLDNGDVLKDEGTGTFPITMTTGLTPPVIYPPVFVTGGNEGDGEPTKLFMFSDSEQVQVVEGDADVMSPISTPALDWASSFPVFGVQHDQRMWAGGNGNNPHRLYYTPSDAHDDFTGAGSGSVSVYPGQGEAIVGAISFRGLLLVFKRPHGIYVVDTADPDDNNWKIQKLNDAVGVAGPRAFTQISNDIILLDQGGNFHLMTGVQDFGDINASNIGLLAEMPSFMRREVSLSNIRMAVMDWYAGKSKAWAMVPLIGATDNNLRIVIDLSDPQNGVRYLLSRRDVGVSIWMRQDATGVERPMLGDDDGFVWIMDEEARRKDDSAYPFSFETSETDLSFAEPNLATRSKNGHFIEVVADLINTTTVNIQPYWDGVPSDPISMELGGIGAALGSFILDTDALGAAGLVTRRKKLTGSGRRIKLAVQNNAIDDEVRLAEMRIIFGIGDERTADD